MSSFEVIARLSVEERPDGSLRLVETNIDMPTELRRRYDPVALNRALAWAWAEMGEQWIDVVKDGPA